MNTAHATVPVRQALAGLALTFSNSSHKEWEEEPVSLSHLCAVFSDFFLIKGIKRWPDPCSWLEPMEKEMLSGQLLLCGLVCAHTASSDVHQGKTITVTIFHTGAEIQIKMSLFTCNCSVTDPKAELPFKSHLAKSFAIKIIISVSSSGTSYLYAIFLCVCGYGHKKKPQDSR